MAAVQEVHPEAADGQAAAPPTLPAQAPPTEEVTGIFDQTIFV